jgi:hypothetical protein
MTAKSVVLLPGNVLERTGAPGMGARKNCGCEQNGKRWLSLLSTAPMGDCRYRDGVIGMDALWSGSPFSLIRIKSWS